MEKQAKKKKKRDYSYPVQLGDMLEPLRDEAYAQDRSLHYWIRKILRSYLDNGSTFTKQPVQQQTKS